MINKKFNKKLTYGSINNWSKDRDKKTRLSWCDMWENRISILPDDSPEIIDLKNKIVNNQKMLNNQIRYEKLSQVEQTLNEISEHRIKRKKIAINLFNSATNILQVDGKALNDKYIDKETNQIKEDVPQHIRRHLLTLMEKAQAQIQWFEDKDVVEEPRPIMIDID